MTVRIIVGDCREKLVDLPDASLHCCVTSPPYFGLRDYGVAGQMGLEKTPASFVTGMVEVFREVRRVLRPDGTLWLNIGDSYAPNWSSRRAKGGSGLKDDESRDRWTKVAGFPPKSLLGIPWRLAFALQDDGWLLRQDIIWNKPAPTPESVKDRCTRAHEYLFLLTKGPRYYFDAEAISETALNAGTIVSLGEKTMSKGQATGNNVKASGNGLAETYLVPEKRNKRSVWTVPSAPFPEAHFATYPPDLIKPCILAGCPVGGEVLDPFFGAGTTGLVADRLGRNCTGIELNPAYAEIARVRMQRDGGMFTEVSQDEGAAA
jgi:DNA modification methylase